jgi:membrane protease subunit (stomatin/prohibitin family)
MSLRDELRPKAQLRERLGWYAMGVAIGLVMLGLLWQARRNAAQIQQARQQPAQPAPATATP